MKTFKLTINEDELAALIEYHAQMLMHVHSIENAARVHDLTKRLTKKDEVEIEREVDRITRVTVDHNDIIDRTPMVKDGDDVKAAVPPAPTGNGWL